MAENTASKSITYSPSEKHPSEDESIPFNKRLDAIINDNTLSQEQRNAAFLGLSDDRWVERYQPPLFVAALSLDPPEVKAKVVEAALHAGADPNEIDHDFGKMRNCGRVLTFYVDPALHYRVRGGLEGLVNNLPAIEILLRYGADPRLPGPFIGPQSALTNVEYAISEGIEPLFYEPAYTMMKEAAARLDEREYRKRSTIIWFINRFLLRKYIV